MTSYETLRAVALLIREGHTGGAAPTPHQAQEMARGIVAVCVAPFMCRVEPTKRCSDFVPIYTAPTEQK